MRKIASLSLLLLSLTFINPTQVFADSWKSNPTGWWYETENTLVTGWKQIDGNWYYFKSSGYMATGWLELNGTWYYLDGSGKMLSNTSININGTIYNFDSSGKMISDLDNKELTVDYIGTLSDDESCMLEQNHQYCTIFYNKNTFEIRTVGGGLQTRGLLGNTKYYNNADFDGIIVDALDFGMTRNELVDNVHENFEIKKIDGKIKLVRSK